MLQKLHLSRSWPYKVRIIGFLMILCTCRVLDCQLPKKTHGFQKIKDCQLPKKTPLLQKIQQVHAMDSKGPFV